MSHGFCGIDFGTSNSALSAGLSGDTQLVPIEGDHVTIPSTIFFNVEERRTTFGRRAIAEYLDGYSGRFMRSLKSILGSSLIHDTTQIGFDRVSFQRVIGHYIGHLKTNAEKSLGYELPNVVIGRPVHFVDDDKIADQRAEDELRAVATAQGFKNIEFEYEPIAAAQDYETTLDREELVLVVDIGGGTSDFSVIRLSPDLKNKPDRFKDILANAGVHIGGNDFDKRFSLASVMPEMGYKGFLQSGLDMPLAHYHTLATWHLIQTLYTQKNINFVNGLYREAEYPDQVARLVKILDDQSGHELASRIEGLKIALSEDTSATAQLDFIEQGWAVRAKRTDLNKAIKADVTKIVDVAQETVTKIANIPAKNINAIFMTGGSTGLHGFRESIQKTFPDAALVQGDRFSSVAKGLGLSALRKFGAATQS